MLFEAAEQSVLHILRHREMVAASFRPQSLIMSLLRLATSSTRPAARSQPSGAYAEPNPYPSATVGLLVIAYELD